MSIDTIIAMPSNVVIGDGSVIRGEHAFKRFLSRVPAGLRVGTRSTLDGVHFAVGPHGSVEIGDCVT